MALARSGGFRLDRRARGRRIVATALSLSIAADVTAADGQTHSHCDQPELTVDAPAIRPEWLGALSALYATLDVRSAAWTCQGGAIHLRAAQAGGLRVDVRTRDERQASRYVAEPSDLSPTVEALFVSDTPPAFVPASVESRATPIETPSRTAPVVPATVRPHTDVALNATVELGARIMGPAVAGVASIRFHASACEGRWCVGGWGRVDGVATAFVDPLSYDRFSFEAIGGGIDAAIAIPLGPGRLDLGPTLGLIRIAEIAGRTNTIVASTALQARVGGSVRWHLRRRSVALVLAVDGDGSIADFGIDPDGFDPQLPRPPMWSAGVSIGVGFGGLL